MLDPAVVAPICLRHGIVRLEAFGSVARGDDGPGSDVDLIATFGPDARPTYFGLMRIERELAEVLGRRVDLVTRAGIEGSPNERFRTAVLADVRLLYAA